MTVPSACFTLLLLIAAPCVAAEDKPAPTSDANIHLRGGFRNARILHFVVNQPGPPRKSS